jgi:hypothetical protein
VKRFTYRHLKKEIAALVLVSKRIANPENAVRHDEIEVSLRGILHVLTLLENEVPSLLARFRTLKFRRHIPDELADETSESAYRDEDSDQLIDYDFRALGELPGILSNGLKTVDLILDLRAQSAENSKKVTDPAVPRQHERTTLGGELLGAGQARALASDSHGPDATKTAQTEGTRFGEGSPDHAVASNGAQSSRPEGGVVRLDRNRRTNSGDVEQLKRVRAELLAAYKADTGVTSDRAIYNCAGKKKRNTHSCHKAEFIYWKNGKLSPESETCWSLERFLNDRRRPPSTRL